MTKSYLTINVLKFFLILFFSFSCYATDWSKVRPPQNFVEAKKILKKIYKNHPTCFYCGCSFNDQFKVEQSSCLYMKHAVPTSLYQIEWEHIVPASRLGERYQCWHVCPNPDLNPGRSCCQKTSTSFSMREANLYNIVPSIRLANRERSNYTPGVITAKHKAKRVCSILIDKNSKIFEPDDRLKGFIARTYLFMDSFYELHLTQNERELFQKWNQQFPPCEWEIERQKIINQIYSLE